MNYTENVIVPERTLLVSLDTGEYDAEESLRELWELAKSGGAEPIATMMQKRPSPETATCVGSGMVEEIRNFCENNKIELIIFDRELTPTQIRNLENATDVRVVDRTMLILDIFAQRAQSRAGKVQVEAAQLKYLLPRLTGKGTALSRLGGGIGTRVEAARRQDRYAHRYGRPCAPLAAPFGGGVPLHVGAGCNGGHHFERVRCFQPRSAHALGRDK